MPAAGWYEPLALELPFPRPRVNIAGKSTADRGISLLAVKISDITKIYGDKKVVDTISFEVNTGEIFALIGPNGAGKTTTIRMMMDIIKPDSGDILVMGKHLGEGSKN